MRPFLWFHENKVIQEVLEKFQDLWKVWEMVLEKVISWFDIPSTYGLLLKKIEWPTHFDGVKFPNSDQCCQFQNSKQQHTVLTKSAHWHTDRGVRCVIPLCRLAIAMVGVRNLAISALSNEKIH